MSKHTDTKVEGFPSYVVRRTNNETGESKTAMSERAYFDYIEGDMLSKRLVKAFKPSDGEMVSSPAWLVTLEAGADSKIRERIFLREKDDTLGCAYSLHLLEWFELADSPGKRYVVPKPVETHFEKDGKTYIACQIYDGVASDCDIVEKTKGENSK